MNNDYDYAVAVPIIFITYTILYYSIFALLKYNHPNENK